MKVNPVTSPHVRWGGADTEALRKTMESLGLNAETNLAIDIANYVSHAHYNPESPSEAFNLLGDCKNIAEASERQRKLTLVNPHKIPGKTFEEKGMNYAAASAVTPKMRSFRWERSEVTQEKERANAKAIEEILEGMDIHEKNQEKNPGGNFGGEIIPNPDKIPTAAVLTKLDEKQRQLLRGLAILQDYKFNLKPTRKNKEDPEGSEVEFDCIGEVSDVVNTSMSDWARPDFMYNLVTKNLLQPVNYIKEEGKRKVYALAIDRSGSMHTDQKQSVVLGVIATIFDELPGAIIYITLFEDDIDGWVKIETKEDAVKYFNEFPSPQGGNTQVGKVIKKTQESIRELRLGEFELAPNELPELIIVNDGQDHVDPNTPTLAPVHAVSIKAHNPDLQTVCSRSKGKYYNIL